MKKFTISILCVAIFFIGLGGLIEETGARFKSDERALNLIKQAQTAIGGETAVRNVNAMTIKGSVIKTFELEGDSRTDQGEMEINLQLPNQFGKMLKLGREATSAENRSGDVKKQVNVIVMNNDGETVPFRQVIPNGDKQGVFVIKRGEADKAVLNSETINSDVKKIILDKDGKIGGLNIHQNELFRTTMALLLTAPQGTDVTFVYAGEGNVDGIACEIVEARNGNSSMKLFLDKSSHLPRMMSYQGFKPMIFRVNKDEMKNGATPETRVFNHKFEKPEAAEIAIKFSDYRSVNGVLLPYRWTQTIGGNADETIDISSYEINPANIAEKFQNLPSKVLFKIEKNNQ